MAYLKSLGVTYIEVRSIGIELAPDLALKIAKTVWQAGLNLSIHGQLKENTNQDEPAFLPSLSEIIKEFPLYQDDLYVTVHAFSADEGDIDIFKSKTIDQLKMWGKWAEKNDSPLFFALELNRSKGKLDPSTTFDSLDKINKEINNPQVGLCWDFGHYYYNMLYIEKTPLALPDIAHAKQIIRTHIHGVSHQTREPILSLDKIPLKSYLDLLKKAAYRDIYNIELDFGRFPENIGPKDGLLQTIEILK